MPKVAEAYPFEGESGEYIGDDGWPTGYIVPRVGVELADGRRFFHAGQKATVRRHEDVVWVDFTYDMRGAEKLAQRVRDRGVVDLNHWIEEDTRTLEERWDDEAMWERKERDAAEPGWRNGTEWAFAQ